MSTCALGGNIYFLNKTGGNPGLNLSSEGHSADQGERHQNGGKEAEETMGDLRFHNHITFLFFCFVELFWKCLAEMIAGKFAYHIGILLYQDALVKR